MFLPGWPEASDAREGLPWHLRHLEADERHRAWRVRVIAERATNLVVGSINLKGPPTADGDVEIGWGISPTHRGRGYAFEAATAVIEWVRDQPGTKSISATIPDDNLASQHLARKLGFVRSEQLRRGLPLWQRVLRDESEVGEE